MAARVLIAILFIYSGFGKLMAPDTVATRLSDAGFPLATVATYVTIAIEIGASIALIFGYRVLACCSLLAGFTLMTSLFFHQFWAVDAAQRTGQTINFLKNLSIIGGLWFVTRSTLETRSLARGIACSAEAA
ncbi:DoxX family membrane protein [Sinorhizobium meliloti]|nr:DoxX family membrane protein [Sinorhizobium meliloti]